MNKLQQDDRYADSLRASYLTLLTVLVNASRDYL